MRYALKLTLAAVLLLGGTFTAFADTVKSDYDHAADFSKFHTYSWGKVNAANPFYVDRIKQSVDKQLQAKGWQLVPSGGEATVFATDGIHNEQELETMYDGMGGAGEAAGVGAAGVRAGVEWAMRPRAPSTRE